MAGETVLAVDDRDDSIKFLREYVLEPNGYTMLHANNGADALRIALSQPVDLVISDLVMPKMGGLELLETLHDRDVDIPVILMTFHGSEGTAVRAFRLGARDYIIKPFAIDEMLHAIDRALSETRLRQERDRLTQTVLQINQQLENRVQELRFLYGIGRSVTSLQDLQQILNRIVEAAAYLTNAEEASLMLIDDETEDLYLRAARGINERHATSFRIKMHDSIAGQVVQTGRPIMIGGMNQDDSFKVKTGYFVKSLLNVPLKVKDRVIGVLAVNNKDAVKAFSDRHLNLLMALADYASVAIENARLYARLSSDVDRAEQSSRQLENLVQARTAELRSANEQLLKSEKVAALGYMAAGVVNEMNEPVDNILAALPQLEIELTPNNSTLLAAIERDILHCRQTIDSLLDFSGQQKYRFQKIPLNNVIDTAWHRFVTEHAVPNNVRMVKGLDPQLPLVIADAKLMEQAVHHLIRNSVLSTLKSGELRITSRSVRDHVQLIISNTGIGLSQDDVRHIFDPFYGNRNNTFGLDLSIAQAIIQRHNGTIEVESLPEQGTTFTVQLPAAHA